MAGLGPAVHDFTGHAKDVVGRREAATTSCDKRPVVPRVFDRCSTGQKWVKPAMTGELRFTLLIWRLRALPGHFPIDIK
jgi:hypothetical protein